MSFGSRKLPVWMNRQENKEKEVISRQVLTFTGSINYYTYVGDFAVACEDIMTSLHSVSELPIGFDLEWPVNFTTGSQQTSLIQLCQDENICHLYHVSNSHQIPTVFINLIRHPKVRVVGVNIKSDLWKLCRDFDISVLSVIENNAVELGDYANKVLNCSQCWSLERLVIQVLKKDLDKSSEIRLSDWSKDRLSQSQLKYAATDAYASLTIYKCLKQLEEKQAVR